jgi:hypothetical protein
MPPELQERHARGDLLWNEYIVTLIAAARELAATKTRRIARHLALRVKRFYLEVIRANGIEEFVPFDPKRVEMPFDMLSPVGARRQVETEDS